jgi:MoxR-like ATPase
MSKLVDKEKLARLAKALDDRAKAGDAVNANAIAQEVTNRGNAIAKEVEDRTNAINKEIEDRDAAIAAALEAYSTTAEVKAIIGNVVNSLALTMENDQVVLKLGGVDGIALTSVSLDLATDDDIDAIIGGLDQE